MTPHLVVPVLSRGGRSPVLKLSTILESIFTSSPPGWKRACEVARAEWDSVALPGWIRAWRGKAWCHSLQGWHSFRGSQQSSWHEWPWSGQCSGGLGGLAQPFQANPSQDEAELNKKPTQCPEHVVKLFSQGFVQTPKFPFSQQEEERKKRRHKSLRSSPWLAWVGRGPGWAPCSGSNFPHAVD